MRNISIFGCGGLGRTVASILTRRGDAVRLVQRTAPQPLPEGCTFLAADCTDREAAIQACAGVDTVICCLGFRYDSALWRRAWPQAMANLIAGCAASGARLVFADNLYMYGPQTSPLTEEMPLTTYGRKPVVRAEVTRLWKSAHDSGRVRAVAVRASDFYGPGVPMSLMSTYGVVRQLAGNAAFTPYSPVDHPHDFAYVPDVARALLSLADAPDDAYGEAWHVPNAPTRTLREVLALSADLIGVPRRLVILPPATVPLIGLFVKEIGELQEMRFQWDRPYIVDSSKFAARFWGDATSFESGLAETISFYRAASKKT
ncbi:MAG TPA: NAD-dependent epimerase/dehydratase family protein [Candidatus Acidoferrales bacterium]|nr:NAD-dependent epimerase/dehydratase family protein [Candidatus Acidoferrales bacterium]